MHADFWHKVFQSVVAVIEFLFDNELLHFPHYGSLLEIIKYSLTHSWQGTFRNMDIKAGQMCPTYCVRIDLMDAKGQESNCK